MGKINKVMQVVSYTASALSLTTAIVAGVINHTMYWHIIFVASAFAVVGKSYDLDKEA